MLSDGDFRNHLGDVALKDYRVRTRPAVDAASLQQLWDGILNALRPVVAALTDAFNSVASVLLPLPLEMEQDRRDEAMAIMAWDDDGGLVAVTA